jgi:hypothetical protein
MFIAVAKKTAHKKKKFAPSIPENALLKPVPSDIVKSRLIVKNIVVLSQLAMESTNVKSTPCRVPSQNVHFLLIKRALFNFASSIVVI